MDECLGVAHSLICLAYSKLNMSEREIAEAEKVLPHIKVEECLRVIREELTQAHLDINELLQEIRRGRACQVCDSQNGVNNG